MRRLFALLVFACLTLAAADSLSVNSIKKTAWLFLPDKDASINIRNSEVERCFNIETHAVPSGKYVVFNFDPTCDVCGKFPLRVVLPSQGETLKVPLEKQLDIPCKADLLIVGRNELSMPKGNGLSVYIQRAAEEGLTVKIATIFKEGELKKRPTLGSFLLAGEAPAISFEPNEKTLIEQEVLKIIRQLRSQVKPRFLVLLGNHDAIPLFYYERPTKRTDGYAENRYDSDHAYGTASENPEGEMVVSVSRIPLSNPSSIDGFLKRAVNYRIITDKPAVLSIYDKLSPFIDQKTNFSIMPFYHGINKCIPAKNCTYAPDACFESEPPQCNRQKFAKFLSSSRHLIFQLHGIPTDLLGPESQKHTYAIIASSRRFIDNNVKGALLHFESCRALSLVDDVGRVINPDNEEQDYPLSVYALDYGGAVGVLGKTGKSSSIDLLGQKGKTVMIGDELMRLKKLSRQKDQMIKLSYYGDPLLKVKTS